MQRINISQNILTKSLEDTVISRPTIEFQLLRYCGVDMAVAQIADATQIHLYFFPGTR